MSRRPSSILLLLVVLAATTAAIWVISTRSRPVLAVYDSMPAPAASSDTLAPENRVSDTTPAGKLAAPAADSASRRPRSTPPARAPATADAGARPHRSDNYGGYSGYGFKERRGDPNAR